ncbi:integral membrane protein [Streptomyces zinciresistens K42]|uniref:Integral membrane protein n=1 Tax=Streptomyces zinciresistens K42 TaxID=700597 RepID=G2G8Y2_9ACTN|nr:integral membrane protein [Streptomyces zinciresistens K42]
MSSGCAPAVLIGGWAIAARLEGPAYDPATETISTLAAYGSSGFWVMTLALAGLGVCHLLTALGLRPAAPAGRLALGAGGVTACVVALIPPPSSGGSLRHGTVTAIGFTLLAVWPVLAARRRDGAPWGLRPAPAVAATLLMLLSAVWFLVELHLQGAAGVAERLVTAIQSLWPFVVVASCLRHRYRQDETAPT